MGKRKADSSSDTEDRDVKKIGLTISHSTQPQPVPAASTQIFHLPTLTSLTPWTTADIVTRPPPLPSILDRDLEQATFTHKGRAAPGAMSYERLEWLGDSYMEIIAGILIYSTFTSHTSGKCSSIREMLVKNETISQYALHYGFEARLNVPDEFLVGSDPKHKAKNGSKMKVLADVFEAYVAAVIQSDPQHGVNRVAAWLKSLWTTTIGSWIAEEEIRKAEAKKVTSAPNITVMDRLAQQIGYQGRRIQYKDEELPRRNEQGLPMFRITCYIGDAAGNETPRKLGEGISKNKKEGRAMAAQDVLNNAGLLKQLVEEKAAFQKELQSKGLASSRWA